MRKEEVERCIAAGLAYLPDEHWWVVQRRFGLDGQASADLDALARDLLVSAEHVRLVQVEALERLVRGLRKIGLAPPGKDHGGQAGTRPKMAERSGGSAASQRTGAVPAIEPEEDASWAMR
jgi:hypothetical protein